MEIKLESIDTKHIVFEHSNIAMPSINIFQYFQGVENNEFLRKLMINKGGFSLQGELLFTNKKS